LRRGEIQQREVEVLPQPLLTPVLELGEACEVLCFARLGDDFVELVRHGLYMLFPAEVVVWTVFEVLEGYQCHRFLHFRNELWFALGERYQLLLSELNTFGDFFLLNEPNNLQQLETKQNALVLLLKIRVGL